jgi:hypothetical protein
MRVRRQGRPVRRLPDNEVTGAVVSDAVDKPGSRSIRLKRRTSPGSMELRAIAVSSDAQSLPYDIDDGQGFRNPIYLCIDDVTDAPCRHHLAAGLVRSATTSKTRPQTAVASATDPEACSTIRRVAQRVWTARRGHRRSGADPEPALDLTASRSPPMAAPIAERYFAEISAGRSSCMPSSHATRRALFLPLRWQRSDPDPRHAASQFFC